MIRFIGTIITLLWFAACSQGQGLSGTDSGDGAAPTSLPDFFDCVRNSGGLLIAAHRGGPVPGFPENALETMQNAYNLGIRVFEVDVATSRDGVLYLMHDRSLGRTTNAGGLVADTDWSQVVNRSLVDNDGRVTRMTPPKLSDVLLWARRNNAIVELDKKETTGWRDLISIVRAAEAEDNVILITYSDDDAALVQRLAPEFMLTASARGGRDVQALEALGVDRTKLIAWTGTREPDAAAWSRLEREGVEAGFGTLGRPGDRLDDLYWEDGDASEYQALVDDGLILLATDRAIDVAAALDADDAILETCGV